MKQKLLFLLIFHSLQSPFGAFAQDFARIDEQARHTPAPAGYSVKTLATALSENCGTEKEKTRAFFVWIADNIRYDIKSFEKRDDIGEEAWTAKQQPQRVLKTKKAVCAGYTNLLNALCEAVGIEAITVLGINKNRQGRVQQVGHAWSLVRTDGQWNLIDATWGAGDVDLDEGKYVERFKAEYFFVAPEALIVDHFPFDPLLQLLPTPLTEAEFSLPTVKMKALLTQKMVGKSSKGFGDLHDSLTAYVAMDTVTRLWCVGTRSLGVDPGNNYGLYNLGKYHLEKGLPYMDAFSRGIDAANQSPGTVTRAWCQEQLRHLEGWELAMSKCLKILNTSTRTNGYSNMVRALRHHAETAINGINKNRKSVEAALKKLK